MQRPIKFRAWHKLDKRRLGIHYLRPYYDKVWVIAGNGRGYSPSEFELMQYTGLKDKNGKEGYHKDIAEDPENKMRFLVDWLEDEGKWILQPMERTSRFYALPISCLRTLVIVGNKYEME